MVVFECMWKWLDVLMRYMQDVEKDIQDAVMIQQFSRCLKEKFVCVQFTCIFVDNDGS